jgi:hypothetical protein
MRRGIVMLAALAVLASGGPAHAEGPALGPALKPYATADG